MFAKEGLSSATGGHSLSCIAKVKKYVAKQLPSGDSLQWVESGLSQRTATGQERSVAWVPGQILLPSWIWSLAA
jgi:hypothetical protein